MRTTTITLSRPEASSLQTSLLALYATSAEALAHAAEERLAGCRPGPPLAARRNELAGWGTLLDQLGWGALTPPEERSPRVTGPHELLAEALRGALIGASDDLDASCRAFARGEGALREVRERLATAAGVVELLSGLEENPPA